MSCLVFKGKTPTSEKKSKGTLHNLWLGLAAVQLLQLEVQPDTAYA